jgi:hypothetical protein
MLNEDYREMLQCLAGEKVRFLLVKPGKLGKPGTLTGFAQRNTQDERAAQNP